MEKKKNNNAKNSMGIHNGIIPISLVENSRGPILSCRSSTTIIPGMTLEMKRKLEETWNSIDNAANSVNST